MNSPQSEKNSYFPGFREATADDNGSLTLDLTKLSGPAHGIVPWNPEFKIGDQITFELIQINPWVSSKPVTEENYGKEFEFQIQKEEFDITFPRFWCARNDAYFPTPPISLWIIK
ncbi:hypothetical protein [Pseudomonas fluorescens]|uniref:hypothetical protein n=1 Tax=Pseudomonas fluorescens TaxID=294 RepID=UPI0007D0A3FF|nr:hypothetical protein [Pseudomonas fluorescens]